MKFSDIINPTPQILGLEKSTYDGNVIQSLIFEGEEGTGKKSLANVYANALVCQDDKEKPCGRCKNCIKFLSDNHPDVMIVKGENKKSIGVETIQRLHKDALIKPNEGGHKIFIIYDAHTLTPQAQNALLKLLEEPPSYLTMILLCKSMAPILETIKSRCSVIPMPYLSFASVVKGLKEKGIDDDTSKILASGASGSLGKALNINNNKKAQELRNKYCDIFFSIKHNKTMSYKNMMEMKNDAEEMIVCWQSLARDSLLFKSGEIDNIENVDKIGSIQKNANSITEDKLIKDLDALCEAEIRIKSSAQFPLVVDWLMSKI